MKTNKSLSIDSEVLEWLINYAGYPGGVSATANHILRSYMEMTERRRAENPDSRAKEFRPEGWRRD